MVQLSTRCLFIGQKAFNERGRTIRVEDGTREERENSIAGASKNWVWHPLHFVC